MDESCFFLKSAMKRIELDNEITAMSAMFKKEDLSPEERRQERLTTLYNYINQF